MALASDLIQKGIPSSQADFLGDTYAVGIVAVGNVLATATPLPASVNQVTGVTGVDLAVRLPKIDSTPYSRIVVRNDNAAFNALVFPDSTNSFNAQALGAAVTLTTNTSLVFYKAGTTLWVSA